MRMSKRIITAGLVLSVVFSVSLLPQVFAQTTPLSEEHKARIRTSCVTAKNTLTQLHVSDALLRVNRGQIYESMTTKLMSRFNSRVDSNRANVKDLSATTNSYGTALTKFRADYQLYEEQLSVALRTDCTKDPEGFYNAVASARAKRTQVHNDVVILHQYIDEYKSTFETFVTAFLTDEGSN